MRWGGLLGLALGTAGATLVLSIPSVAATGSADLSLTNSDFPDPNGPRGTLTYVLSVHNAGPDAAQGVELEDTIPRHVTLGAVSSGGGLSCSSSGRDVTCTAPSLASGADATATISATVDASADLGTVLGNVGVVYSTSTFDPLPTNNVAGSSTTLCGTCSADLSLAKSESVDPVAAGGQLVYTLTVHNAGPDTAYNVALDDTMPLHATTTTVSASAGVACQGFPGRDEQCSMLSLAPNADAIVTIKLTIDAAAAAGTVLGNIASVYSLATADPNRTNNTSLTSTTVGSPLSGSANLSLAKSDNPDPVAAGATLTYVLTLHNSGPDNAQNVSLEDTLPLHTSYSASTSSVGLSCSHSGRDFNCTAASLALGADATATIDVLVDQNTPGGTLLANVGTAYSTSTGDPGNANNSGAAATAVGAIPTPSGSANLSLTDSDNPDPVAPGGTLTYTLTVHNSGPDAAQNVRLEDTVPLRTTLVSISPGCVFIGRDLTCAYSTIAAGEDAVASIQLTVDASAVPETILGNVAAVYSKSTADPGGGNNVAPAGTRVAGTPTGVAVTSLTARYGARGVIVRWVARSPGLLGFDVFAGTSGGLKKLTRTLIAAAGSHYAFVDRNGRRGAEAYWLRARGVDGSISWYGPAQTRAQ